MVYLTYDDWNSNGYQVISGVKSEVKNSKGQALFHESQVMLSSSDFDEAFVEYLDGNY